MSLASKHRNLLILSIIGIASLLIRLLIEYEFDRSALLYVGIPFFVAVALLFVERPQNPSNWKRRYINIIIMSLIVMLGSSIVLFEGFVCVVMFMPIYFAIILLMFLFEALDRALKNKQQGKHYVHLLPILIVLSAFEGVVPELSFERDNVVVQQKVIAASIEEIKQQLLQPMQLDKSRHWLLSLFPMPYNIEAETLKSGDIHHINFRYHRWIVTNTHEGAMHLEISEVKESYIRTRFVQDSSYIANYMQLYGTEIYFAPLENGYTKVTLKIHYQRILDPVWYFEPVQQYAVGKVAQFLLDEVFTPKVEDGV
jgi:hypothetical protein